MNSAVVSNNAPLQPSHGGEQRGDHTSPTVPEPSSSLLAEYGRMLLCVHAVFCAAVQLLMIRSDLTVAVSLLSCLWVVVRVVPAMRWRWWFPLLTLGGICGLAWLNFPTVRAELPMIDHGPFSAVAVLFMLALVLSIDVVEAIVAVRRRLQVPHVRSWRTAFMIKHGLRMVLFGTVGFIVTYSIAVPLVQEAIWQRSEAAAETDPKLMMDRLTLVQNMLFKFSESTSAMWFFVVGSCVGSFLNVVIYRVPAGISVLAKASHCPVCQTKIASRDNLPLIGWLKLQGQCRSCATSISSRYPSVELTIGLLFLLLFFVELISGGTNLPGRAPNHYAGVLWILFYTKWDLVGLYLFHCFVFCALFSWTMMGRDGNRIPLKAALITIGLVATASLLSPHLLPWENGELFSVAAFSDSLRPWLATTERLLSGAAVGIASGWLVCRAGRLPFQPATWLLIGMAFGWQAVVCIGLLCLAMKVLVAVATALAGRELPEGVNGQVVAAWWYLLPIILLVHHCLWRPLALTFDGGAA